MVRIFCVFILFIFCVIILFISWAAGHRKLGWTLCGRPLQSERNIAKLTASEVALFSHPVWFTKLIKILINQFSIKAGCWQALRAFPCFFRQVVSCAVSPFPKFARTYPKETNSGLFCQGHCRCLLIPPALALVLCFPPPFCASPVFI